MRQTSPFPPKTDPAGFMSGPAAKAPRKRLFIGLITGAAVLLCLFLLLGWIIPVVGLGNIHPGIPYISGLLLAACIGVIAWAALSLVLQIVTGKKFWGSSRVRGLANRLLLPCMEPLARLMGIPAVEVRRSFIKVNNELADTLGPVFTPEGVVILLPHCLQRFDCEVRLTATVDACRRCGRCPIAGLLRLRDRYGVRLAIATGGSVARRIVEEGRPRLIVAVACERDLTSGIQDTHPLPVYGILNERPQGPCRNTTVSLLLVENALRRFLVPETLPPGTMEEQP